MPIEHDRAGDVRILQIRDGENEIGPRGRVRAKLPPSTARAAIIEGRRFAADEAIAGGLDPRLGDA